MRSPPKITKVGKEWRIDYRVGSKRVRRLYADKSDAERAASEVYLSQFTPVEAAAPTAPMLQVTLFKDAIKLHLDTVEPEHSKTTDVRDRSRAEQTLIPVFGERPLHEITPAEILEYRNARAKTRAAATVNRELCLMSAVYKTCIEVHDLVQDNPVRRVKRLHETSKEAQPLAQAEAKSLIAEAETPLKELIVVAIFTGLRPGEIFHLRWVDVDFEKKFIDVTSRKGFVTKTRRSRRLPMNAEVENALRSAQAHQARVRLKKGKTWKTELVFPNEDTGEPLVDVGKAWDAACKRAKLGHRRLYDLRHTFGTWAALAGEDLFSLQRWMGHQSIVTTERYAKHRPLNFRGKLDDMKLSDRITVRWGAGGR
jgi:integrase